MNEEKLFHLIFTTYQNYPLALNNNEYYLSYYIRVKNKYIRAETSKIILL